MNELLPLEIKWEDVIAEFDWIPVTQGEGYTMTYLLRHPEVIRKGARLMGVEVAIPVGVETLRNGTPKQILFADAIFAVGNHFYVVEAEETIRKKRTGEREARERARAFEELMKRNGRADIHVTPVFVGIRYPKDANYGYLVGVSSK